MLRPNLHENKELPAPQAPLPPVQILDAIAFEEKYIAYEIDPSSYTTTTETTTTKPATAATPATTVKTAKKKISLKEKVYILTSSAIPAIGFGLGNTVAVLLKFVAPVASVGGAGLTISTGIMVGLTGGFGLFALGLFAMMYHNSTKEAIKKIELFNNQLERLQNEIDLKSAKLLKDFNNAFAMLLKLKLSYEQLKRTREASDPYSLPSATELSLKNRINSYIDFLAQHQNHPNFQKIDNKIRNREIEDARQRQINIRIRLYDACEEILNNPVHVKDFSDLAKDYVQKHSEDKELRACFPSLHFVAPKAKRPPFINISLKEFTTAFFGAFGGIFGLPFLTITLIGTFTAIPMAFPPLYPILAIAIVYGMYNLYRVNDTKKLDAERNVTKLNMQKHLAYYHYSHNKLLKDRLTKELADDNYIYNVMATELMPRPQEKLKQSLGPVSKAVDYTPSSDQHLPTSISSEDLSYKAPSQLTPLPDPDALSPAEVKREEKTTPTRANTPGLSFFNSRNSDFGSSSGNLPRLRSTEDLTYRDPSTYTCL